jgi:hypothetical protein
MVDGVSPDAAALLGHIVVVAKTVLAAQRPRKGRRGREEQWWL